MGEKQKVEAVLFASGRSMEEQRIAEVTGLTAKQTSQALAALQEEYITRDGALFIWNEGNRWKINVREDYAELIKGIAAETEMSSPVMATLALIAHRSPVLQSEVIKSRGDGAYNHIAELVDKEFITKEKFQRSYKLKLAEKFYNYFDVEGQDIREAFKDIKPSVKPPKKLGKLDVVDAETDDEAEMDRRRRESQLQIYDIQQQRENDKGFLDEFDDRLGKVKVHVDEAEEDIVKQKQDLEEETNETDKQPTEENSAEEEDDKPQKDHSAADNEDPQELAKEIDEEIDELTKGNSSKQE